MKKTVFAGNTSSQYNPEIVLKESADFFGQALRTIDARSVTEYYSHFRAEYNTDNNPTKVSYYRGTKAYNTNISFTSATGLEGKYFVLHSAPDNQLYIIWYKVNGIGIAPVVANAKYIEVSLTASDSAEIVAALTRVSLEFTGLFSANRNGSSLSVLTSGLGFVDASFDVNTGFTITGTDGEQVLVEGLNITYLGTDPVYEGQVLYGYSFDIYSGKFVKNPKVDVAINDVTIADSDGDQLQVNPDGSLNVNIVSTGQQLKSYFFEIDNVATGVTEELCSYTPTAPVYLQKIEFSGTNIATFELYVDGIMQDKKLTYFSGNLGGVFEFNQGLNIAAGEEIQVRVYHNRPDPGEFNARMQILES